MRKAAVILLIFLLFFNLTGYYILYQFRLYEVKTAMKASLRRHKHSDKVLYLSVSLTEKDESPKLECEDENEFMLEGQLYDVIEKHKVGDQLVISCISDKEENLLLQQYQKTTTENNKKSKNRTASLLKMVSSFYERHTPISLAGLTPNKTFYFPFITTQLPSAPQPILTPPPKVASFA